MSLMDYKFPLPKYNLNSTNSVQLGTLWNRSVGIYVLCEVDLFNFFVPFPLMGC